VEQPLITLCHSSLPKRGEEERMIFPICEETEKILEAGHFQLVRMSPDKEVGKCQFGNRGWRLVEKRIEERFVFKGQISKVRKFRNIPP